MFDIPDLFSVKGRVALITGGGTGLGRIAAEALLSAGARVLIASRKAEVCEEAARELSGIGPIEGFGGSVGSEAGVAALAEEVQKRTDKLHILVNNAGANWGEPYETYPWRAFDRVLSVNVTGLFQLTRLLTPMLKAAAAPERPAAIVNLSSVMATVTQAENAYAYSASKAAVSHLTRILASELAAAHVTVNAIAPGPFHSNMTRFAMGSEEGEARAASTVPMGRVGAPKDMAGTLLYLVSRAGAYTTGASIPLDGGIHCAAMPAMFGEE